MFISCPHCRDLVATDRETNLPPALCPRCGGVLREETSDAVATVDDEAADGRSLASFLHGDEASTAAARVAETGAQDSAMEVPEDEAVDAVETHVDMAAETLRPVAPPPVVPPPTHLPSFTRQNARPVTPARAAKWQWAALAALALLLGLQVLVADRARLAADASWRPMIVSLCDVLGCSVPAWHQPGAIAMLSRAVSPIVGSAGGLNVQATFRNDARWSQPWPILLLSLSDADGRVLGSRAFTPREYLGAAATQKELAPGQSAQIALKLYEPNPDVVAFSFDFR